MADPPCRGAKKVRGENDADLYCDVFLETHKEFSEMLKKLEAEKPDQYASFRSGMNDAVEDMALGDLICDNEFDEVKMKLDELDQAPKLTAMKWLEDNNWFVFEKEGE